MKKVEFFNCYILYRLLYISREAVCLLLQIFNEKLRLDEIKRVSLTLHIINGAESYAMH